MNNTNTTQEELLPCLMLAHKALSDEYAAQTRATQANKSANATCGESAGGASGLALLVESGYMHSRGKQTQCAIDALFIAIRDYRRTTQAEQPAGEGMTDDLAHRLSCIAEPLQTSDWHTINDAIEFIESHLTSKREQPAGYFQNGNN